MYEEDQVGQEESLFEYVDDREYARIVQRRQEEGFVLDDGEGERGEGGRGEIAFKLCVVARDVTSLLSPGFCTAESWDSIRTHGL